MTDRNAEEAARRPVLIQDIDRVEADLQELLRQARKWGSEPGQVALYNELIDYLWERRRG